MTLIGAFVELWPYSRGLYPRDTLYTLWKAMEVEGGAERLFYPQRTDDEMTRGDLTEFVRFFDAPGQRALVVATAPGQKELAGFFWFDDIVPAFRASVNVWMRRRYWGKPAREGAQLFCEYGFDVYGFQSLWAFTPWHTARRMALATGFTPVTTLPRFCKSGDRVLDIHVLRRERHG